MPAAVDGSSKKRDIKENIRMRVSTIREARSERFRYGSGGGETGDRKEAYLSHDQSGDLCGTERSRASGSGRVRVLCGTGIFASSANPGKRGAGRTPRRLRGFLPAGWWGETSHVNKRGSVQAGVGLGDWKASGSSALPMCAVLTHAPWRRAFFPLLEHVAARLLCAHPLRGRQVAAEEEDEP